MSYFMTNVSALRASLDVSKALGHSPHSTHARVSAKLQAINKYLGLWIDHRKAVLISHPTGEEEITTMLSEVEKDHSSPIPEDCRIGSIRTNSTSITTR